MLKGVNRNVLVVNPSKTGKFEAVYFVLRKGDSGSRADILNEANRIIASSGLSSSPDRKKLFFALFFALGLAVGIILTAFACFIVLIR